MKLNICKKKNRRTIRKVRYQDARKKLFIYFFHLETFTLSDFYKFLNKIIGFWKCRTLKRYIYLCIWNGGSSFLLSLENPLCMLGWLFQLINSALHSFTSHSFYSMQFVFLDFSFDMMYLMQIVYLDTPLLLSRCNIVFCIRCYRNCCYID